MPEGKRKSGSKRKIFKKTPGSRNIVSYEKRKPSVHKCAECGQELKGIPRRDSIKMKNSPKTTKRPERPYGGYLCSKCARKKIIEEARS